MVSTRRKQNHEYNVGQVEVSDFWMIVSQCGILCYDMHMLWYSEIR